jgi:HAD superfamily hydrolase (TIGR01509 family)
MPIHAHHNRHPQLQAVIFDMDGVIIDSHPAHRRAWRKFLHSMGRNVTNHELDFILDGRKRAEILRYFLGEISQAQLEEHGKRKDDFFHDLEMEVKPIPGVVSFLDVLQKRKIATAVATSASESRARSTLARLHLTHHFQAVITGGDVEKGKPDPAIYSLACQRLNIAPQNALAIEDAVSGIRAARGAGLRCVGVSIHQPAEDLMAAGADCVIDNFLGDAKAKLELILQRSAADPPDETLPVASPAARG